MSVDFKRAHLLGHGILLGARIVHLSQVFQGISYLILAFNILLGGYLGLVELTRALLADFSNV